MQILIVHRDAVLGEQLVQMVRDYTAHECELVSNNVAAVEWGRAHARCTLLLTQVLDQGVDGLVVGGQLSELFPGLQTLFLPAYPASEQRLEVTNTKVFPEPIDGEGLLAAIARAEAATPGTPDWFHVVDVLQMCCLSQRGGAIQMVRETRSGIVFLRGGQIVHAETTACRGKDALLEMIAWEFVEFAYDGTVRPPVETIPSPWDGALIEAVARHKQQRLAENLRRHA
ncbi:MAG: DUF4388 domain-containing protein [Verrucomicrobiota bacterium]